MTAIWQLSGSNKRHHVPADLYSALSKCSAVTSLFIYSNLSFLFLLFPRGQAGSWPRGVGECCSPERQHQVQWAASCVGATCTRISLRYVLSKVKSYISTHKSRSFLHMAYSDSFLIGFLTAAQAQHISAGVHRPAGAHVPTQHPRHQTAVPPLCYWAIVQRGHRRRRTREQHPPHPLHHPHCPLRPQHVCTFLMYNMSDHRNDSSDIQSTKWWDVGKTHKPLLSLFDQHSADMSHVFPILISLCHCSTRATSREEKNLQSFQEQPCEKWVESSYEVEGPHYFTILAMHIMPPERWRTTRIYFLRRLLVNAHTRKVSAVYTNKYDTPPLSVFCPSWFYSWPSVDARVLSSTLVKSPQF